MKTLSTLTRLSGLALSPLLSAEPLSATHPLFQAIRAGDAAGVDELLQNADAVNADNKAGAPALTPDEAANLRAWINQGATWPEGVSLHALLR